jgi:hypothetical protein
MTPQQRATHQPIKGGSFGPVVLAFCVVILLFCLGAILMLTDFGAKLLPHRPNPHPNASITRPTQNPTAIS